VAMRVVGLRRTAFLVSVATLCVWVFSSSVASATPYPLPSFPPPRPAPPVAADRSPLHFPAPGGAPAPGRVPAPPPAHLSFSGSDTAAPATVGGDPSYGIADAQGAFLNYWNNNLFYNKTNNTGLEPQVPLTTVRFFVPWDAFGTANSSGQCIDNTSSTYTTAQLNAQAQLYYSLEAASPSYDNLDVLIVLNGGNLTVSGDTAQPTDSQYQCGFIYLANAVRNSWGYASFAHEYEIYNEPDEPPASMCASTAAEYYIDAEAMDNYLGGADSLIAGGFGDKAMEEYTECGGGVFVSDYLQDVLNDYYSWCTYYGLCHYPAALSGHPYDDPDASYSSGNVTTQTSWLVSQANYYTDGEFATLPIWLTETAVWLTNIHPSSCQAGSGHSDVDSVDNNTFAACVDDSPIHQATAAGGWLNLANVSQVARVYYYEFQAGYNWDSALVAPDGARRPSYCMLIHADGGSASSCAGDTNYNDTLEGSPWDQDYQDNPNGTQH
jgi:hypothetical protein